MASYIPSPVAFQVMFWSQVVWLAIQIATKFRSLVQ
jgi:hypothetical protein